MDYEIINFIILVAVVAFVLCGGSGNWMSPGDPMTPPPRLEKDKDNE